jgi:predicted nucleotidyltransferase
MYNPFHVDLEYLMENIKEQYVNVSIEEAIHYKSATHH